MKRTILYVSMVAACVLFVGCPTPVSQDAVSEAAHAGLPAASADVVADVLRPSGSFDYTTLMTVSLDLKVDLQGSFGEVPSGAYVQLTNSAGRQVFGGKLLPDGTLRGTLQVPAAPDRITLTVAVDGFVTRTMVIEDMYKYAEITRTIGMVPGGAPLRNTILPDTDGDGVPDAYDAAPSDPNVAFSTSVPPDGNLSVAYEDLFGQAQAGDADYNDFVAAYKLTVGTNAENKVTSISGVAKAVTKLAGYDHKFGLLFSHFTGSATLSVKYFDAAGMELSSKCIPGCKMEKIADIVLFEHTKYSVGRTTEFTLTFAEPQDPSSVDQPPYNPYLYVYNTKHDVHLIGEEPLPSSINPTDTYRDAEGFPWGLLVPADWINPAECQRIEIPYPRFTLWRESMGAEHTDWYLHYNDPWEPPPPPPSGEPVIRMAADIYAGSMSSFPSNLTVYNNALYFAAYDGTTGDELRRFDGTSVSLVEDLYPGAVGAGPNFLVVYNNALYFSASNANATQLYSYSGSGAPTAHPGVSQPSFLRPMGTRLYMDADDGVNGMELLSFDGSAFALVKDINAAAGAGSFPCGLTVMGTRLYFSANDGALAAASHRQLWSSDGTSAGTTIVYDLWAGGDALSTRCEPIVMNNALYFPATTNGSSFTLHRYGGSGVPAPVSSIPVTPTGMVVYNGSLYLCANDGSTGWEPYSFNGTTLSLAADINPGSGDSLDPFAISFYVFNNELYFGAADGVNGRQLWKINGSGASLVKVINPTGNANPITFASFGGKLYFQASDGTNGSELWELAP